MTKVVSEKLLARQRLHGRRVEAIGIEHHRQLVAGQRPLSKNVQYPELVLHEDRNRCAARKGSSDARTRPAPTWPTPASRCAMPVLISGRIPVSTTRRTSIPVGVPRKSSAGI